MTESTIKVQPMRVLIVEDETLVGMMLKHQLEHMGHTVVGHASGGGDALPLFRQQTPDLVLMDIRLADADGLELAAQMLRERPVAIVIISAYSDRELIERARDVGAYGYLIKPVNERALEAQIEVAVQRFREHQELTAEVARLEKDLETRKLLEKAKGILMRRAGLAEDEAHRRLLQESQRRRIGLQQLCRTIIESDQVMGGGGA